MHMAESLSRKANVCSANNQVSCAHNLMKMNTHMLISEILLTVIYLGLPLSIIFIL